MSLLTCNPDTGDQITIDVRTNEERMNSAVDRLERLVEWFEDKLPHAPQSP